MMHPVMNVMSRIFQDKVNTIDTAAPTPAFAAIATHCG